MGGKPSRKLETPDSQVYQHFRVLVLSRMLAQGWLPTDNASLELKPLGGMFRLLDNFPLENGLPACCERLPSGTPWCTSLMRNTGEEELFKVMIFFFLKALSVEKKFYRKHHNIQISYLIDYSTSQSLKRSALSC